MIDILTGIGDQVHTNLAVLDNPVIQLHSILQSTNAHDQRVNILYAKTYQHVM